MIRFVIAQHDQEVGSNFAQVGDFILENNGQHYVLDYEEFDKLFLITHIEPDMSGEATLIENKEIGILNIEPSVGSSLAVFSEKLLNIYQQLQQLQQHNHSVCDSWFYKNIFSSLPKEQQKTYHTLDWKHEDYGIECIVGGMQVFNKLYQEHRYNFQIRFTFNGCLIALAPNTTIEDVIFQWENYWKNKETTREKWLLTEEGIKYTEEKVREAKKEEKKVRDFKKLLNKSFTFSKEGESIWNKGLEKNNDPYGRGVYDFAKVWAYLMEQEIKDELTQKTMESCCSKANAEGITGFMYGAAVSILSQCWKYGEQLRKIHNGEYSYEGEGTVNPAVVTLS